VSAADPSVWALYRDLLSEVPAGTVHDCVVGLVWTLITTETGDAGVSQTFPQGLDESLLPGSVAGADVRLAAQWLASWNYYEAAIGCAALNAVLNTRERVERMTECPLADLAVSGAAVFERVARDFAGGKVAVVGHFPALDVVGDACDLVVLEQEPQPGDTPAAAAEYLLAQQDCVCITGTSVINKTLPRLLELSRGAYTVLIGPTVPLSPVWFQHGVDLLAGAVITDAVGVRRCVQEGAHRRTFREGLTTVQISADDLGGR
jgi:uncharacterized protein (DUF4213/DUF364 family)